jgi:hypothetical protein
MKNRTGVFAVTGQWRHLLLAGLIGTLVACGDHPDDHGHAHDNGAEHSHADGDAHGHDSAPETEAFYVDDVGDAASDPVEDPESAEDTQSSADADHGHDHEDGNAHSH